jgi:acetoin utilization deacetylase AcuC-like enzyme
MKFFTNAHQHMHKTVSQLEIAERLSSVIKLVTEHSTLNIIDKTDFSILYEGLSIKNQQYISNILSKIKMTELANCKFCSWKNIISKKIVCQICDSDISSVDSRYGYFNQDCTDTSIHENTHDILINMLSTLSYALLNDDGEDVMFITRPPGHHCSHDSVSGFCYLNWSYLLSQYYIIKNKKVCIIDLDLHHGNGTEELIKNCENSLFIDYHYYDGKFYPKSGNEKIFVANNIINVNMPAKSGDTEYLAKLDETMKYIDAFNADLYIISMGCDIIQGDNFNIMNCSTKFYKCVYDKLKIYNKQILIVLEGGYIKENITETVRNFI